MKFISLYLSTLLLSSDVGCPNPYVAKNEFPNDFIFGVSTSAYQVEGAWNKDGRSESIWDRFVRTHPELIEGHNSTGDKAADTYTHYERDAELLKDLGVSLYRFSISWSRLLPHGFNYNISEEGVTYYVRFIEELVKNDIHPMAVLHDWDLPQSLQELGGWANPLIQTWFADYAKVAFEQLGHKVKYWITIHNPRDLCYEGYGNWTKAPGVNASGVGEYLCIKNVLLAHAKVYRMYEKDFKSRQEGGCGISVRVDWFEAHKMTKKDLDAVTLKREFEWGVFLEPIFSENGGYPEEFTKRLTQRGYQQRFTSRLPELSTEEIDLIRGSADFMVITHYTAHLVSATEDRLSYPVPSMMDDVDVGVFFSHDWSESGSPWLRHADGSLTNVLDDIHTKYPNKAIYVEYGWPSAGGLTDDATIIYLRQALENTVYAVEHGIMVKGFIVRSFLDGFELNAGYTEKFGLYEVDYEDEARTRTPRKSMFVYKAVIKSKSVDFSHTGSAELNKARQTAKPKYREESASMDD